MSHYTWAIIPAGQLHTFPGRNVKQGMNAQEVENNILVSMWDAKEC